MADNWLATAGTWLVTPARILLRPWWQQLVEKKAESEAVRVRLLEAIVRFRLTDFRRRTGLDEDRAVGLSIRIIERLKSVLDSKRDSDHISPETLRRVEEEIELQAVERTSWIQLACLCSVGDFRPRQAIVVDFRGDTGTHSHGSDFIPSLQDKFPFTRILTLDNPDNAKVSSNAVQLLKEYCSRMVVPETTFEVADAVPGPSFGMTMAHPRTLTKGWSPRC